MMAQPTAQLPEPDTMNLLLIDDDETLSKLFASGIRKRNPHWKVSIINAVEFLDLNTLHAFDLILLDLVMPGFDGIQCLRQFSETGVTCPIILVSGLNRRLLNSAASVGRSYGLHIAGIFNKPMPWPSFFGLVDRLGTETGHPDSGQPQRLSRHAFARALDQGELSMQYQPRYASTTLALAGLEASTFWQHPVRGRLSSCFYLPFADACGLLETYCLWTLQRVLADIPPLEESLGFRGRVCIALPPPVCQAPHFPDRVFELLEETGVNAGRIQFQLPAELAETGIGLETRTRLAMKGLGVSQCFPTLQQVGRVLVEDQPCDEWQLSCAGIAPALTRPGDQSLLREVIKKAHENRITVAVSGIDDADALQCLQELDCDIVQGGLLSAPLTREALQSGALRRITITDLQQSFDA